MSVAEINIFLANQSMTLCDKLEVYAQEQFFSLTKRDIFFSEQRRINSEAVAEAVLLLEPERPQRGQNLGPGLRFRRWRRRRSGLENCFRCQT